jgi:hypothetical protein
LSHQFFDAGDIDLALVLSYANSSFAELAMGSSVRNTTGNNTANAAHNGPPQIHR